MDSGAPVVRRVGGVIAMARRNHQAGACALAAALSCAAGAKAAPDFEIYGFAEADWVQDFQRVDPNWNDTLRPSRIPTTPGEFGPDGQSIIGVRQSRFGVQAVQPIADHDFKVKFEFDLFGTASEEGKTTFHLRRAYGQWGPLLAGQTETNFMDIDTFPNVVDYWGPPGMVFVRTPQVRLTFKSGGHEFAFAIERPSNDVDPGQLRIIDPEIGNNVEGHETIPDFTAHWRYDGGWGHIQIAGILRKVGFETIGTTNNEPKGSKLGWGVNGSANIKVTKKDVLHLSAVYGEGIATYMNDGGVDLAPGGQPLGPAPLANTGRPVAEVAPLLGLMAYYDHYWSDKWSTSIGWSETHLDNTSLQEPTAFHHGQYASANLLFTPDKHLLMGAEFLWGERQDKDHAVGHDTRVQVSFKYSFTSKDFFH
jgi:hypothetical protein